MKLGSAPMIDQKTASHHQRPLVFSYRYELVGNRTWRKDSAPEIREVTDPPTPSLLVEKTGNRVVVYVYDAFPSGGTDDARELVARPRADAVLRRRFHGCSILDPNEGRG